MQYRFYLDQSFLQLINSEGDLYTEGITAFYQIHVTLSGKMGIICLGDRRHERTDR